jgi:hypothetical protein
MALSVKFEGKAPSYGRLSAGTSKILAHTPAAAHAQFTDGFSSQRWLAGDSVRQPTTRLLSCRMVRRHAAGTYHPER